MTAHLTTGEYQRLQLKPIGKQPRKQAQYIAKRADANQPQIVSTLRHLGFMVQHLHEMGSGVFDLLISKHGLNILAEVKDGGKSPSARQLTRPQKRFHFSWAGMRCVLTNDGDCYALARQVAAILQEIRKAEIKLEVTGSTEKMYAPGFF